MFLVDLTNRIIKFFFWYSSYLFYLAEHCCEGPIPYIDPIIQGIVRICNQRFFHLDHSCELKRWPLESQTFAATNNAGIGGFLKRTAEVYTRPTYSGVSCAGNSVARLLSV